MSTVFVVQSSARLSRLIVDAISSILGITVQSYSKSVLALHEALESPPDLIITDVLMPTMNGIELVRSLRSYGVNSEVIFLAADEKMTVRKTLPSNRIRKIISKPCSVSEIFEETQKAVLARMKSKCADKRDTVVMRKVET